jgi:subtilisin family serine protease
MTMFNRVLAVLAAALLATSAFAQEARQRYTIATKGSPRAVLQRVGTNAAGERAMRVRTFANLDGFAAELTAAEAAALRETAGVESVDPAVPRYASQVAEDFAPVHLENFDKQITPWGVPIIRAAAVWPVTRGEGVNVVVIDTGLDLNHPDLKAAYAGGYNVFDPGKPPADDNTHGTHVAGTIAAANNAFGVVGVAPGVKLWAVKALDQTGKGDDVWIAAALDWVITKQRELGGRWVVNMSLGSAVQGGHLEEEAVKRSLAEGVILVAAAGNRGAAFLDYPAVYPGVIAVGAVGEDGKRADFSSWGLNMPVVAPGVMVESAFLEGFKEASDIVISDDTFASLGVIGSPKAQVTGKIVYCGLGNPQDFPASVKNNIALISRGTLEFREKSRYAKEAGAAAVIIADNEPGAPLKPWTLWPKNDTWEGYAFPLTIGVTYEDGEILRRRSEPAVASFEFAKYGRLSGTSMAAPHVAAVAAMMVALKPQLKASEIAHILELTARDTAEPGWDFETGWGIVDALAAAHYVAPDKFDVPPPPPPTSRRRSARH